MEFILYFLLIGRPLVALREHPLREVAASVIALSDAATSTLECWTWRSLGYLHVWQQRSKWTDKTSSPNVGDLVLVKNANLPPLRWHRGRIINLFPDKDGTPRFAEVMVGLGH